MSGNVGFLLIVVVVSLVGSAWLWARSRKPTTTMSSVESFQREMQALGRDPAEPQPRRRRGRGTADPIVPAPEPTGLADDLRSVGGGPDDEG